MMNHKPNSCYDIIIVGGGLVGYSLALALRDLPVSMALLEAVPPPVRYQPDFDMRTLALAYSSQRIFREIAPEITGFISDTAQPIQTVHVSSKGHFGAARFHAKNYALEAFGGVIDMQQLLMQLVATCKASSKNIDFYCPAKLVAIKTTDTDDIKQLQLDDGSHLHGRLIIAADGVNSTVRQLLKIPCATYDYAQFALATNVGLARHHQQIAYERFTADGHMALLPIAEKRMGLIWVTQKKRLNALLAMTPELLCQEAQTHFGYRLGRFTQIGKCGSFPLIFQRATQPIKSGVILMGSAAQHMHPVAAQGFNLALRDVARLARALKSVKNYQAIAQASALQTFIREAEQDRQCMANFTHALVKSFAYQLTLSAQLRSLSLLSLDSLPLAKQLFIEQGMGLPGISKHADTI